MLLRFQCAPILTLIRLFRLCFYIRLLVLKHRQVSVHITNLPVLRFYRDAIVDLGYSGRENWQLQLWHASLLPAVRHRRNHFSVHSDFIDPWKKSGEVRMSVISIKREPQS